MVKSSVKIVSMSRWLYRALEQVHGHRIMLFTVLSELHCLDSFSVIGMVYVAGCADLSCVFTFLLISAAGSVCRGATIVSLTRIKVL